MFKKIVTMLLTSVLVLQPVASQAGLSDAFTSLTNGAVVSVNKPGRYQSGARNSFSGGGLEIRAPRQKSAPQLFSFTPPSVSAGCGGISATFGGFSFISGAEFEAMLKQLASGAALGFVSMIAIKSLCPTCEAVIQFLKTAAQQAARLSKDSCRWGQEMGAKMMGDLFGGGGGGESARNYCTATNMTRNAAGDAMSLADTIGGYCYQMRDSVDRLLRDTGADSDPDKLASLACVVGGIGNTTWPRLTAFDNGNDDSAQARRLLWMNLMGAELAYAGAKQAEDTTADKGASAANSTANSPILDTAGEDTFCETEGGGTKRPESKDGKSSTVMCPPRIDAKEAMLLFMCGAPNGGSGVPNGITEAQSKSLLYSGVTKYCEQFLTAPKEGEKGSGASALMGKQVYYCADARTPSGPYSKCNQLKLGGFENIALGEGFLVQVMKALYKGVDAVRSNTDMPEETIKLIQVAPFPLYQAINAAAVYPSSAQDLIGSMGTMVAEQIAVGHLDQMLRLTGRAAGKEQQACLSAAQATQILEAIASSRNVIRAATTQMAANLTAQEMITAQIRHINLAIQKQVLSSEMLTSNLYSQGVTGQLTSVLPKAANSTTSPN